VVSLFFSLSRGGILSALLSGTILLALFWRRLQSRRTAWALVIGLPAVVVAITVWIGAGIVLDRFQSQPGGASEGSFRYRAVIGSTIVRELPNFLWVGAGLGAFEESFAPYTPPGASARWDKAHNDYLQIAWELGLAGALLVAVTVAIYVWRYAWPAVASFGEPLDLFRTGVAVGLLSIALHSSVDFSLQMGADGALFAVLTGLLVSLTRLTARGKERPEPVPEVAGA
jgi:O-antigen ligase